jgi:SAM-dependent methyltransferase
MTPDQITILKFCSYCDSELKTLLNLGSLPPVNVMNKVDEVFYGYEAFPLTWAVCVDCGLVQILEVLSGDAVFPESYPYLSGTTRILRENFKQQFLEIQDFLGLTPEDLIVDIGSNDGTLLSNYKSVSKVLGVEPTNAADVALARDIPTLKDFFSNDVSNEILSKHGQARVITACNVFAHIPNLSELMGAIKNLLADDGVFISESHYLYSLIETLQFDTIYHEHLRYYSLEFLNRLFDDFGLEIIRVSEIPTHGGSIRVWAAKKGTFAVQDTVARAIAGEFEKFNGAGRHLDVFVSELLAWRHNFRRLISEILIGGNRIAAIGAPSRASTLVSFTGLTHLDIGAVGEISGSHKIGRFMPGTSIPIVDEQVILDDRPEYLLILSWHIAEELIPILRQKGFKGSFILPLPDTVIVP